MTDKTIIGRKITELRKAAGMTQSELAEQLNVSYQAVSQWERSETLPDIMMLPMLAEIFGVGIGVLFGETVVCTIAGPAAASRSTDEKCKDTPTEDSEMRKSVCHSGDFFLQGDLDYDLDCDGDVTICGAAWAKVRCSGDLTAAGDVNCAIECAGDMTVRGSISGLVNCGGDLTVEGDINYPVNCGGDMTVSGTVRASVTCGGELTIG